MELDQPLSQDDIYLLAHAASLGRKGERDYLLVMVLTVLEVSEALSLKRESIAILNNKKVALDVVVKGGELKTVRCPSELADKLQAYAKKHDLAVSAQFFPICRQRVHQIVKKAASRTDLNKRISPRLLRTVHRREVPPDQ